MITDTSKLTKKQLQAVLQDYELGEVCGFWPATQGMQNTNYYINTSKMGKRERKAIEYPKTREYVLTLLEQSNHPNPIMQPLLSRCTAAGLPVARLIANKNGTFAGQYKDQSVLVCPRLQGRHVFNPTRAQCSAIGRFLGRFHRAGNTPALQAKAHPASREWLLQQTKLVQGYIPHSDASLLHSSTQSIVSMLARDDVKNLPRGIIHGDLFRDNVLFNERGLSGVLDFHDASRGFWLLDLTVAINDWCGDSVGVLDVEKTLALVSAYNNIRPLTRDELWHFPVFALYAAIIVWLSRLSVAFRSEEARCFPFKNPEEFRKITEQRASHFFYLDARRLAKS